MDSQIQNKLLQYAPKPPEKIWEAIAGSLDETFSPSLSEKLYQFEQTPPAEVWDNIHTQLTTPETAPVKRLPNKHQIALRYIAAAAILLFIAIGILLLVGRRTGSSDLSKIEYTNQNQRLNSGSATADAKKPSENNGLSLTSIYASKNGYHRNSSAEERLQNKMQPKMHLGSVVVSKSFIPRIAEAKQTVANNGSAEKYMVYSDGNGHVIKMSKKLFDFIACVKEDIMCQQQMESLQQKFASTVNTDFTGVLEMLKNLKENQ